MQVETIYKLIKLIGYISLTFSDWLLTSGNKFSVTLIEEMNKEELNACLKSFYTSARKQDGQFYKSSSLKAIRAAIDRYLRMSPHSKQFSIVADPAFTEANKILDAFLKELRKSGKLVVLCIKRPSRNSKLRTSSKAVNLVRRTPKIQHSFKEQRGSTLAYTSEDVAEKISEIRNQPCLPSELRHKEKSILSSTESFPARCQRRKTIKVAFPMLKMSRTRKYFLCQNLTNAR